jgi:XTP/dITP diphosphohydrolase
MSSPPRLILATRNAHKAREFAAMLGGGYAISDLTSVAAELPPVEESGSTFEENARLKALAASRALPGLVLADDSGLVVTALRGEPGIRSARYAGECASDGDNTTKVLAALRAIGAEGPARAARFVCAIVLAERGEVLGVFTGAVKGRIAPTPRGGSGFGYDPVFVPDGANRTFAELGEEEKNKVSHRARAIAQLRDYLARRRGP